MNKFLQKNSCAPMPLQTRNNPQPPPGVLHHARLVVGCPFTHARLPTTTPPVLDYGRPESRRWRDGVEQDNQDINCFLYYACRYPR